MRKITFQNMADGMRLMHSIDFTVLIRTEIKIEKNYKDITFIFLPKNFGNSLNYAYIRPI